MYVHILPFQNTCSLAYFQIKIFVRVDEAESISCAFLYSLSIIMVFLISDLYYASSIFEIVEST